MQPVLAQEFDDPGQDGDDDNCEDNEGEVLLDHGNITEKITGEGERGYPDNTANDIIADKAYVGHAPDTGHKRRKSSDDGDKTGDNNCLTAVLFKKLMCPVQILFIEEPHVLLMKDLWPHEIAYPVVCGISQDSGNGEKNKKP